MYLCLVRPDRQTAVVPGSSHTVPNNEQPARADRLGHVYSLVDVYQSQELRVVLQILIGNRCSDDKGANSTWCSLLIDTMPARPTN